MELMEGIEPSYTDYKTVILPLNYASKLAVLKGFEPSLSCSTGKRLRPLGYSTKILVHLVRIELTLIGCNPTVLPLNYKCKACSVGLEPTLFDS